jgi:hypothetical protein
MFYTLKLLFALLVPIIEPVLPPTIHGSYTYNQAQYLFFPDNIVKHGNHISYLNMKNMDVFVSYTGRNNFNFFFHKNHTIFAVLWSKSNYINKQTVFSKLKLWHAKYFNTTLDAQLYDMIDVEAWYGRTED